MVSMNWTNYDINVHTQKKTSSNFVQLFRSIWIYFIILSFIFGAYCYQIDRWCFIVLIFTCWWECFHFKFDLFVWLVGLLLLLFIFSFIACTSHTDGMNLMKINDSNGTKIEQMWMNTEFAEFSKVGRLYNGIGVNYCFRIKLINDRDEAKPCTQQNLMFYGFRYLSAAAAVLCCAVLI